MNFHFHITIDKNGVSQTTASHEKIETPLTEEEKIENIVRMFRDRNMPDNLVKQDCYLNDIKEKIGQLSNVNQFVKSAEVQYTLSLLFHASRENFPEAVDMLLEKGADPSLVNNKGISVLHLMAKKGQLDMAEKCCRKIPWFQEDNFVNQGSESGWTPLMSAAENGQYDFAKWLISFPNCVEVNKQMKTGWTAMHSAAKKNNEDMVKLLLLHGGNQNIYGYHKDFGNCLKVKNVTKSCKVLRLLAQYDCPRLPK